MAKYKKKLDDDIRCPLEYGLMIFGGKWKSRIIWVLSANERLRYSEIRKEMYNITDAVLAATLKDFMHIECMLEDKNNVAFYEKYGFSVMENGADMQIKDIIQKNEAYKGNNLNIPKELKANAFIAPGVCIACAGHSIDHEQRAKGISTSKPVTIEKDVWIGANSVICGGVTIGEGSVIGAGSVVTKSIPANVVAVGNPCRVLREVREEDRIPMDELAF